MPELRSSSSCVLAVALALAACAPPSTAAHTPPDGDGHDDPPGVDAHSAPPADAHAHLDAAVDSSPMIDAAGGHDASVGGDAGTPGGIVACYTTGNPEAMCT